MIKMGFFSFNKIPRHRVFHYHPRYYDPDKDARDSIIRQAKIEAGLLDESELDDDIERAKLRITKAYRSRNVVKNFKKKGHNKSGIRVAIIAIILFAITYILINFDFTFLVRLIE